MVKNSSRNQNFKRNSALTAAAVTGLLAVASFAWACTPAVTLDLGSNSAPAGTLVQITGTSAERPIEIRWNSTVGPLLAKAPVGQFATSIQVPADATPGVYYILADGRAKDTFEVTGPGGGQGGSSAVSSPDLWSGFGVQSGAAVGRSVAQAPASSSSSTLPLGLALAATGIGGLLLTSLTMIRKRGKAHSRSNQSH